MHDIDNIEIVNVFPPKSMIEKAKSQAVIEVLELINKTYQTNN